MFAGTKISQHLEELRKRLKVIILSLVVTILAMLLLPVRPWELLNLGNVYYATPVSLVLQRVMADTLPTNWNLLLVNVGAPLEVIIYASLILGLVIDMPLIAYEAFRFVDPALRKQERDMVYPVVASASLLFIVGILFGYYFLARFIFVAMAPFNAAVGLVPPYMIAVSDYYTIVFLCVLFSGAAFTSPVFVFLLIRYGIVSPGFFGKHRLIIWGVTFAATAFITPDGGPLLDVILFVPIIVLLEVAVLVGRWYAPSSEALGKSSCLFCGEWIDLESLFCQNCGKART